jgi:hypothetical protein
MAMPAVSVDLVKLALLKLQQATITSLEDTNSPAAQAGLLILDNARRALIRNYNWNFSRKRGYAQIVPDATPAFDYNYYYVMPSDCLKVTRVGERGQPPVPYDIEGRNILIDPTRFSSTTTGTLTKIPIVYLRDVADPSEWDPLFTDLFVIDMAIRLCSPLGMDSNKEMLLQKEKISKLAEAVAINSQERPLEITDIDPITQARWNGFVQRDVKVDSSYFDV